MCENKTVTDIWQTFKVDEELDAVIHSIFFAETASEDLRYVYSDFPSTRLDLVPISQSGAIGKLREM